MSIVYLAKNGASFNAYVPLILHSNVCRRNDFTDEDKLVNLLARTHLYVNTHTHIDVYIDTHNYLHTYILIQKHIDVGCIYLYRHTHTHTYRNITDKIYIYTHTQDAESYHM